MNVEFLYQVENKKLPTFIHFKSRQFGNHSKKGKQKALQMP